jgi:hypothetical protein
MPQAKPGYEVSAEEKMICAAAISGWFCTGRFVSTARFHVLVCIAGGEEEDDNVVIFVCTIGGMVWQ